MEKERKMWQEKSLQKMHENLQKMLTHFRKKNN